MDCKTLIYHRQKQQAIAPIYPHYLCKWDVSGQPRLLEQIELPYNLQPLPSIVLLPDGKKFAIAPSDVTSEYGVEVRCWDDLSVCQQIRLPHAAYEETSLDDEYYGHPKCTHISWLGITPCQNYLLVGEGWGDIYLVNVATKQPIRWLRRWRDYNADFAIDPQMQFIIVNSVDMDEFYHLFRIENIQEDQLTYLGEYEGGVRCHRGGLSFSPNGQHLAYTRLYSSKGVDLVCRQFQRSLLRNLPSQLDVELRQIWQQSQTYLPQIWTQFFPLHHDHDELNPWQSDVAWLDNRSLVCGVGKTLAIVEVERGIVLATYDIDAVINTFELDAAAGKVIIGTKEGIKVIEIIAIT